MIACGTRTQHRMVVNIEDAGFEIRDVVSWIYGSGFPKSLNVSKAIDKAAGAEREVVGVKYRVGDHTKAIDNYGWKESGGKSSAMNTEAKDVMETAPATEAAKQWDGWGSALKPACEFFTLCRKPLSEKTIAANVLKWGTGGINIDGCRVESGGNVAKTSSSHSTQQEGWDRPWRHDEAAKAKTAAAKEEGNRKAKELGRFPANLIHDGSQEVLELFPETKSGALNPKHGGKKTSKHGWGNHGSKPLKDYGGNQGSAARFFYCAKASKKDRNEGCEELEEKESKTLNEYKNPSEGRTASKSGSPKKNNHPTVKPTALMQYLCRLITPPQGVVLDPYMGSGSTGKAAIREGFSFVGVELDEDYYNIAKARVNNEA